jgi:hypothetical protein
MPSADRRGRGAQVLSHLADSAEAPVPQPLVAGLEPIATTQIVESITGEGEPGSRAQTLLVEEIDDLGFAMVVEKLVDPFDDRRVSAS